MNELIDKLMANAGITSEQAQKSLETIKEFVKEKFPMLGGAVDNIFKSEGKNETAPDPLEAPDLGSGAKSGGSWLDKISDIIPGDIGEKMEAIAKKATEEGSEAFDKAKEVASDAFAKAKEGAEDLLTKAKETFDSATKK
jgi:vacuolar-type H+-ATPase subunit E/Vma4